MKFLRNRRLNLVLAIILAFGAGIAAHKSGIHRDIKAYFKDKPPELTPAEQPCKEIDGETICASATPYSMERRDRAMLKAVKRSGIPDALPLDPSFPRFLDEALGIANIRAPEAPAAERIQYGDTRSYEGGSLQEVLIPYAHPAVSVRSLYATHVEPAKDILVILHGLASSAEKVMGLDQADYHREIGKTYFRRGMDVLAFDTTTQGYTGSTLSLHLMFYRTTTHGLATRGACDALSLLKLKTRYRRVILYGLSNGSMLAHYIATLCEGFDMVVADDGVPNWRPGLWSNPAKLSTDLKYPMFVNYRRPLFQESSIGSFYITPKSPLYVVIPKDEYVKLADELTRDFESASGIDSKARVNFVFKQTDLHVPETKQILDNLFADRYRDLDGVGIVPRATAER